MRWTIVALTLLVSVTAPAAGQGKSEDAFAKALFDPQLVLKHAQTLGLTPAQRKAILDEFKSAQIALAPLQVDMAEPALEMVELLENTRVDEAKVMAKIDAVLRIENEVKKRQAVFIIRVKNILTPEQQAKLREIRDREAKDAPAGESSSPTT